MTLKPVYYPTIPEGSPARTRIMQLNATDEDNDPLQLLHFKIISGNPEGFFSINTTTGNHLITNKIINKSIFYWSPPACVRYVIARDRVMIRLFNTYSLSYSSLYCRY